MENRNHDGVRVFCAPWSPVKLIFIVANKSGNNQSGSWPRTVVDACRYRSARPVGTSDECRIMPGGPSSRTPPAYLVAVPSSRLLTFDEIPGFLRQSARTLILPVGIQDLELELSGLSMPTLTGSRTRSDFGRE